LSLSPRHLLLSAVSEPQAEEFMGKEIENLSTIPISRPVTPPQNASGEPQPTMNWVAVPAGGSIPTGAVQANDAGSLFVAGQVFGDGMQAGAGVAGPTLEPVSSFLWSGSVVDPAFTTFGVLVSGTSNAVQWVAFPTGFPEGPLDMLGTPQPIPLQPSTYQGSLPNGPTIVIRIAGADPMVSTSPASTVPQDCDVLCYGSAWFAPPSPPSMSAQ